MIIITPTHKLSFTISTKASSQLISDSQPDCDKQTFYGGNMKRATPHQGLILGCKYMIPKVYHSMINL